jgi:hypothetical protein
MRKWGRGGVVVGVGGWGERERKRKRERTLAFWHTDIIALYMILSGRTPQLFIS